MLPQIADPDRSIARLYEMLDESDLSNVSPDGDMCTVRWDGTRNDPSLLNFDLDSYCVPHRSCENNSCHVTLPCVCRT